MKPMVGFVAGLSLMLASGFASAAGEYTAKSCYTIMKNNKVVDETCWTNNEGADQNTAYLIKYLTFSHIYSGRAEDSKVKDLRGVTGLIK